MNIPIWLWLLGGALFGLSIWFTFKLAEYIKPKARSYGEHRHDKFGHNNDYESCLDEWCLFFKGETKQDVFEREGI